MNGAQPPPANRQPPSLDAATWSDAGSRDALALVTSAVAELVRFEVATIGVVRGPLLHQVTVAGSADAADALLAQATPVEAVLAELARADNWGRFRFVPQERREGDEELVGWVPDLEAIDAPDAWHPLDLFLAPLHDQAGDLIGLLSIDVPLDRRHPGPAQREMLERYAMQAERALRLAVERDDLAERMRLTATARQVVRFAALQADLESVLDDCREPLLDGFRADMLSIRTYPSPDQPRGGSPPMPLAPGTRAAIRAAVPGAWRDRRVIVMGPPGAAGPRPHDGPVGHVGDRLEVALRDAMARSASQWLLVVPLGAGQECLGHLILGRERDEPWSDDERVAALGITSDIGQAIAGSRARVRAQRLASELRQLTTYKTQLLNTVSHELKNPLAVLTGHLEMLGAHDGLDDEARQAVDATGRAAGRMSRIVDDLLVLAQVEDPGRAGTDARAEVIPVVLEGVVAIRAAALVRRVTIDVDAPDGDPLVVRCSAGDLDRVVTNLVGNAVKYSPDETSVAVRVSTGRGEVEIAVTDHGIGISYADQQHLFSEFFRSTNPEALARPGTGLGLTICRRILEQCGGRIEVESELGEGSTFRVVLPLAPR